MSSFCLCLIHETGLGKVGFRYDYIVHNLICKLVPNLLKSKIFFFFFYPSNEIEASTVFCTSMNLFYLWLDKRNFGTSTAIHSITTEKFAQFDKVLPLIFTTCFRNSCTTGFYFLGIYPEFKVNWRFKILVIRNLETNFRSPNSYVIRPVSTIAVKLLHFYYCN